jgi:uncharacterized protein (TIGR02145 family)
MKKQMLLSFLLLMITCGAMAQVKMGHDPSVPAQDASLLELSNNTAGSPSDWQGLLLPQVDFSSTTDFPDNTTWGIAGTATEGAVVYNTSNRTAGGFTGPGTYVWDNGAWVLLKANRPAQIDAGSLSCSGALAGTYIQNTATTAGNTKTISVNVTRKGTYSFTTGTIAGISFSANGVFTSTGVQNVVLTATGTPTASGTQNFTVTGLGQSCNFSVDIDPPVAVIAAGSLNCGGTLGGTYREGTAMAGTNTKTISVNVTSPGTYSFTTPTVAGISFSASGTFAATGTQNVTLAATGTPTAAGTYTFTVTGQGQTCNFDVTIIPPVAVIAAGSLDCGGALAGTYIQGSATTAAHTKTIQVNVTTPGTYTFTSNSVGGISFAASGVFASAGLQNVVLTATGTPFTNGINGYTVTGLGQNCNFSVSILPPPAVLASGSMNCGGALAGTYMVGTATTASNTKTIQVNVTTTGSYTFTTGTAAGVSFAASGSFSSTGVQNVVLTATGTPTATGNQNFTVSGLGQSCDFMVSVVPAPAVIAGGSLSCGGALAGTYVQGTAMTAGNTKTISVNVTSPGSYSFTTSAVSGITYAASGVFASTGVQNVVLTATGTPSASGVANFTVSGLGQSCNFDVNITPAPAVIAAGSLNCGGTLNGTYVQGTAMGAGNTKTISVNVTSIGTYNFTTGTAAGISFSGSGTFTTTGVQNVVLTATGTPTTTGTQAFTVSGLGQTCNFNVTVSAAPAAIAAGSLTCGGTLAGGYMKGEATAATHTKTISVNVTATGPYSFTTNTVAGISFSGSGNFTTTGAQNVVLTATGTPNAAGIHTFTVSGLGQSCNFDVRICDYPTAIGQTGCITFSYRNQWETYTTVMAEDEKIWLQQNLGASKVAAAAADPDAYGDLFQWGRWDDGHQLRTSATANASTLSPNNPAGLGTGSQYFYIGASGSWFWQAGTGTDTWSDASPSATNGLSPCAALGAGWHIPTRAEFENVVSKEGITDTAKGIQSNLKLVASGQRNQNNGNVTATGSTGYYWTTSFSSDITMARNRHCITVTSFTVATGGNFNRSAGMAVRCVKD